MGERKGQNKYYPPDFDPAKHGNLNRYHGTHALRERATKIHLGILIIRFEMPFNIWCLGCERHVAMGVRYNAEKKKVGNYYTTPIYEFRMKCHLCDNYFVIRTDPKNFDYELVEGLRRQEKRWEPSENGQGHLEPLHAVRKAAQALATDAMFKLEHGEQDRQKSKQAQPELEQILSIQDRMRDDYMANRLLRDSFRTKKHEMKAERAADDELKEKASLPADMKLVALTEQDRKMAAMLAQYSTVKTIEEKSAERRQALAVESIFGQPASSSSIHQHPSVTPSSSSSSSSGDNTNGSTAAEKLRRRMATARHNQLVGRLSTSGLSTLKGSIRIRKSAEGVQPESAAAKVPKLTESPSNSDSKEPSNPAATTVTEPADNVDKKDDIAATDFSNRNVASADSKIGDTTTTSTGNGGTVLTGLVSYYDSDSSGGNSDN